jgi:hypothetical protein
MARPVLRDPTMDGLAQVMNEYEYQTTDEAVRHLLRECGYDE